jgi:hypothetical protein
MEELREIIHPEQLQCASQNLFRRCGECILHTHTLFEIKYRVSVSVCSKSGEHCQQVLNSANPRILQGITSCKGEVIEVRSILRSLYENLKTKMLTIKAAHCPKTGNTEGESSKPSWWNVWKFLMKQNRHVLETTPSELWASFSTWIGAFHFLLFLEPIIAQKSRTDLRPLLDIVDALIISTAESECLFRSMNDAFSPTRNLLLLKTVSHLIFLKSNGHPLQHFRPEGFVRSWIETGRHHADVTVSKLHLTEKRKIKILLKWKLYGSTV